MVKASASIFAPLHFNDCSHALHARIARRLMSGYIDLGVNHYPKTREVVPHGSSTEPTR
jgi:hypothetical protein